MSEEALVDAESEADSLGALSEALMVELVKLRKKRKIGQAPIAEAIGMSQSRVSQIENLKRNVHLETVLVYARAIGCKIVVEPETAGPQRGRGKPDRDRF